MCAVSRCEEKKRTEEKGDYYVSPLHLSFPRCPPSLPSFHISLSLPSNLLQTGKRRGENGRHGWACVFFCLVAGFLWFLLLVGRVAAFLPVEEPRRLKVAPRASLFFAGRSCSIDAVRLSFFCFSARTCPSFRGPASYSLPPPPTSI